METCIICGKYVDTYKSYYKAPAGLVCFECGNEFKTNADNMVLQNSESKTAISIPYSPKQIKKHLDEYVIGQDKVKEALSIAIYNHYKRLKKGDAIYPEIKIDKSNILLGGDSGTGKTYICKTISDLIDVPFTIVDATAFTQAGYVGEDIETILTRLYIEANGDISKAEMGIVFIDEIDKLGMRNNIHDSSGLGVQQSLLKFLEGSIVDVPTTLSKKYERETIQMNTDNILFICSGAFVGLDELNEENLINYGLIPELVGRLTVKVKTNKLTAEDFKNILTKTSNNIISQYKKLFALDGIRLDIKEDAVELIANAAYNSRLGARSLKTILESILHNAMYELPKSGRKLLTINKEYIDNLESTE